MTLRRRPRCPTPARRWWLAGAVLAVLAAQWLALVHTVVHAGGRAWPVAEAAAPHAASSAWVQLVAGHDAGSASCLLLDQLAQAAPCADPPVVLPPALPPAVHHDTAIARVLPAEWVGFRARGPPHVG